ncbi:MAG: PAC2 family protein [Actinomycetota bacterium]|nr:PAC2 family protein [Actinomycetota bacterium]
METLRWTRHPALRSPIVIAAFAGWNDAGDAASGAIRHLSEAWETQAFCDIDPEEFFDFTEARPQVMIDHDQAETAAGGRRIVWPVNVFEEGTVAADAGGGGSDIVLLQGTEPQLRWRTFAAAVAEVAESLGASMVVTAGALLADVTHRRPVRVTGSAADPELARSLHLLPSNYEGPTGIVGVLHDTLAQRNIPSVSLWASVPHYVSQAPSPKAALAIVDRIGTLTGLPVDTSAYDDAVAQYEKRVEEVVNGDEVARAYVEQLEKAEDEAAEAGAEQLRDLAHLEAGFNADRLAEEAERYLRRHGP